MKTTLTSIVLLFISISVNAQIKKYNSKQNVKTVTLNIKKTLPLLKVTKGVKLLDRTDLRFDRSSKKITQLNLTPGAYTKYPAAINVTFDASKFRTTNASLAINGTYNGEKIVLSSGPVKNNNNFMYLNFKAVKNKTYRITVNYYNSHRGGCPDPVTMGIDLLGSTEKAVFNIDLGEGQIDFLVQTEYEFTKWVQLYIIKPGTIQCNGKDIAGRDFVSFEIHNVSIRQLED